MDETRRYEDIISDLYDGVIDEAAWERGLRAIACLVGGQGPLLLALDPSSGRILRDETRDYSPRFFAEFRRDWATKDIRVPAGLHVPVDVPITEAGLFGKGVWERTEIFNEFCVKQDAAWFLATWVHKSPTKMTCVSIQATADRGPFSPEDARRVQPLLPHLRRALDIRDRLEANRIRAAVLQDALDRAPFGMVVLDAVGRILDVSPKAVEMLDSARALVRQAGRGLVLADPPGAHLRQLLRSRMRQGDLSDGSFPIHRGQGRSPLSLVISPLPSAVALWTSSEPRWLLFVFDPERRVAVSAEALQRFYSLSPREAELASRLAAGGELMRVATAMGVAIGTARKYLKTVFSKTGARSQADLVRLILSGPVG